MTSLTAKTPKIETMKVHRYAELFPLMEGAEFAALVQSMKKHGYLREHPIILIDEQILDGRNRFLAAEEAGVKPFFNDDYINGVHGVDPLDYVIAANVDRRHLTPSQLAVIAIEVEKAFAIEADKRKRHVVHVQQARKGRAGKLAAEKLKVSESLVNKAKAVAKNAPDLIPAIREGKLTVSAAKKQVRTKAARKDKKVHQEYPREVMEHLDAIKAFMGAIKTFSESMETAAKVFESDSIAGACVKFSPEAERIVNRKYYQVRGLLMSPVIYQLSFLDRKQAEDDRVIEQRGDAPA